MRLKACKTALRSQKTELLEREKCVGGTKVMEAQKESIEFFGEFKN